MRIVDAALGSVMLLFALVQYNDPDALPWIAVYGAAAVPPLTLAWRPTLGRRGGFRILHGALLVTGVALTLHFWPQHEGWWRREVWWEIEAVREGLGVAIATAVLAISALAALAGRPASRTPVARDPA